MDENAPHLTRVACSIRELISAVSAWRHAATAKRPRKYEFRKVAFLNDERPDGLLVANDLKMSPKDWEGERRWKAECARLDDEQAARGKAVRALGRALAKDLVDVGAHPAGKAVLKIDGWVDGIADSSAQWGDLKAELEATALQLEHRSIREGPGLGEVRTEMRASSAEAVGGSSWPTFEGPTVPLKWSEFARQVGIPERRLKDWVASAPAGTLFALARDPANRITKGKKGRYSAIRRDAAEFIAKAWKDAEHAARLAEEASIGEAEGLERARKVAMGIRPTARGEAEWLGSHAGDSRRV